jgi:hypothetical protein
VLLSDIEMPPRFGGMRIEKAFQLVVIHQRDFIAEPCGATS